MARAAPWRQRGDQSESREKRTSSRVKEDRFQGEKEGLAKKTSQGK